MQTVKGSGTSRVDFHQGRALLSVSNRYPSLFDALLELVQNSIGVNARNVWVKLNRHVRSLVVQDDGDGVDREFFDKALQEVCSSQRTRDEYGRFGMGLYSPLAKCAHYTFTSCPRRIPQGYIEWSFEAARIEGVAKDLKIEWKPMRQLRFVEGAARQRGSDVPWRTQVRLYKYTPDRRLSRVELDALEAAILDRFIVKMRANKVVVHVAIIGKDGTEETREIRALDFRGRKLDEVVITNPDAGRTTFRIYLAQPHKGRSKTEPERSRVLIGLEGDPHRINFEMFVTNTSNLLSEGTTEALRSGVFEGEIITTKPQLAEDRKAFEDNDALVGFYDAVETWYSETGSQYFERVRDTKREERFQQLTLPVLEWLAEQLRNGELPEVEELIDSFQRGTVGPGHVQPRSRDVVGKEQGLALAAGHAALHPHGDNGNGEITTNVPSTEHAGHIPLAVTGPRGSRRTVVKHGSLGITVVYDDPEILHMRNLWKLDTVHGRLLLNTQHPDWVKCEKGGERKLQQLIALLTMVALNVHSQDPEFLNERLEWADTSIKAHIAVMMSIDTLRKFRPKVARAFERTS